MTFRNPLVGPLGADLPEGRATHCRDHMRAAVTALVPVKHYRPEYLGQAVASLLAQSSPRWRALIVHEREARRELEAQLGPAIRDPRIRLVEERGRKLAGALNTGMWEATTEFTAILFADDLWPPDTV